MHSLTAVRLPLFTIPVGARWIQASSVDCEDCGELEFDQVITMSDTRADAHDELVAAGMASGMEDTLGVRSSDRSVQGLT